jgi:hypothetical protein
MIALTVGEGEAEGEADFDADGEADGSPCFWSSDGDAEGEVPAVGADGTGEGEPADSDFCGPHAVAASATAVATPSARTMTL